MRWREHAAMDFKSLAVFMAFAMLAYSAWLTSIVFCASNNMRPLLVAAAAFFPIGIIHGIGVWFGGW